MPFHPPPHPPPAMKLHLSLIPEEGLERSLRLPLDQMHRLTLTIGAQTGEVVAELTLKNHEGSVEITGELRVTLMPPCQRCLKPIPLELDEPMRVALSPVASYDDAPEDTQLSAGDLEVSFYEGEELDLAAIVEEELLLLIPDLIVEEDEEQRCLICGKRMEELFTPTSEPDPEHPFAKMKDLLAEE